MNEFENDGRKDALRRFGLHAPPPAWSHKAKKKGQTLTVPSSMEKKAFDPLSVGIGLGSHALANLGGLAARRWAPGIGGSNFASGLEHGFSGRTLPNATRALANYGIGPESLVNYDAGRALAEKLQAVPPAERTLVMDRLAKFLENPELKDSVVARSAAQGLRKHLAGDKGWMNTDKRFLGLRRGLTSVAAPTTPAPARSWVTKALAGAGGLVGGAALGLHAPMHVAINALRAGLGHSPIAEKLFTSDLRKGVAGQRTSPLMRGAKALAISPAMNDAEALGHGARNLVQPWLQGGNNRLQDAGLGNVKMPTPEGLMDAGLDAHKLRKNSVPKPPPAPRAAPVRPAARAPSGALTKGLMLGGGLLALRNALRPDRPTRADAGPHYAPAYAG